MTANATGRKSGSTTAPSHSGLRTDAPRLRVPGLLLAWSPAGIVADDRAPIDRPLVVGRSCSARWCVPDQQLSRLHLAIEPAGSRLVLADRGSRNGTYLGGERVTTAREVEPGSVIRAGECVFVVVDDLNSVGTPGERAGFGMAGPFHAPAIERRLRIAARTGRNVLIEGETGSGKELAARALHGLTAALGRAGPLVAHNAARFAGEDDAVTTSLGD